MGRLARMIYAGSSGLELDGEVIPWSKVHWVGAEVDEGQLVFGVGHFCAPAGVSTRTWSEGDDGPDVFDADAELILAAVREHCPRVLRVGWLARSSVAWEPVAALPERHDAAAADYRSPGAAAIVAHRVTTPLESRLAWLCRLRDPAREIVVTHEHVYAERSTGIWRVPLGALAERDDRGYLGNPIERILTAPRTHLYTFGRRALLEVLHRDGCPVQAALDAILAAKD